MSKAFTLVYSHTYARLINGFHPYCSIKLLTPNNSKIGKNAWHYYRIWSWYIVPCKNACPMQLGVVLIWSPEQPYFKWHVAILYAMIPIGSLGTHSQPTLHPSKLCYEWQTRNMIMFRLPGKTSMVPRYNIFIGPILPIQIHWWGYITRVLPRTVIATVIIGILTGTIKGTQTVTRNHVQMSSKHQILHLYWYAEDSVYEL